MNITLRSVCDIVLGPRSDVSKCSKIIPKMIQKSTLEALKSTLEALKSTPAAPESTPEAPKSTPEAPEGPKRGPRRCLCDFGGTPWALLGDVFDLKFI